MRKTPFTESLQFREVPAKPPEKKYPWELEEPGTGKFFDLICIRYLARIFDPSLDYTYIKDKLYRHNGKYYLIKSNCLPKPHPYNSKPWYFKFGEKKSDSALCFGFIDETNPSLEFCLDTPREKFKDGIKIVDDGYHLKGFKEFWIDQDKLKRMQELMTVINNKDGSKLESEEAMIKKQNEEAMSLDNLA